MLGDTELRRMEYAFSGGKPVGTTMLQRWEDFEVLPSNGGGSLRCYWAGGIGDVVEKAIGRAKCWVGD